MTRNALRSSRLFKGSQCRRLERLEERAFLAADSADAVLAGTPPGMHVVGYSASINDVSVNELDSDTGPAHYAQFTITVNAIYAPGSGGSSIGGAFNIHYATISGTAQAGPDYVGDSGDVSFRTGGGGTGTVRIRIRNDVAHEATETFSVRISNPNITFTDSLGVGTIYDNDANYAPIGNPDQAKLLSAPSILIDVLKNDTDRNGDLLHIHAPYGVTQPAPDYGTVTQIGNQLQFTPGPKYFSTGQAIFSYIADDIHGFSSAPTTVSVSKPTVLPPPSPDAIDDSKSTRRNTPVDINVLTNDEHFISQSLTIASFTQGAHGSVVASDHGTLIYRPAPTFLGGQDTFSYQIVDSQGNKDPDGGATVTVTVSTDYTPFPTSVNVTSDLVDFDMIDWNGDFHQDLVRIQKTGTASGRTEIDILSGATNFQTVLFHAATVFLQTDATWTFKIASWNNDAFFDLVGIKKSNTGSHSTEVHVASGADGFQTFLAHTATALPEADANVQFELVDWDHNGTTDLAAVRRNGPSGHTELSVVNASLGLTSYFPGFQNYATGFLVTDQSWDFQIIDWDGNGQYDLVGIKKSQTGSHSTELHILSGASNFQAFMLHSATELPETDDSYSFKILDFDANAPKDLIAIQRNGNPSGKVTVYAKVAATMSADSLLFSEPNQHAPIALGDTVVVPSGGQITIDVLANDSDPDGNPLIVTDFTTPAHGELSLVGDGTIRYTPFAGFAGDDSFSYTINDGNVGTATGLVSISVLNGSPTAGDDVHTRRPTLPTLIDVRANDFDPNGDAMSVVAFTQGAHGVVTLNAEGSLVYTPDPNADSSDTFGYTIADGHGGVTSASVTLIEPRTGDANGDDLVDGSDYTVWADHFLAANNGTVGQGDFNHDGIVDGADYVEWADNFATITPAAALIEVATKSPAATIHNSNTKVEKLVPVAVDRAINEIYHRAAKSLLSKFDDSWLAWLAHSANHAREIGSEAILARRSVG